MKNNSLFPEITYKTISSKKKNKLVEHKVYTSPKLGQLDLKCALLDYYNISSTYITNNIVKRGKKNIKINWIYYNQGE